MKGKGRKGEPEEAEREGKLGPCLLLGAVRGRILLEGPHFSGHTEGMEGSQRIRGRSEHPEPKGSWEERREGMGASVSRGLRCLWLGWVSAWPQKELPAEGLLTCPPANPL